jgi:hypothetical protein
MASQAAFDSCSFVGATSIGSASPVSYTFLTQPVGTHVYFACNVGSHCTAGTVLH